MFILFTHSQGETVLSWLSGWEAPRVGEGWAGRARRAGAAGGALGGGSLNVSAVRETDAGLFRCRVSFPNRSPPARNNGTFYYLDVDGQSPSPRSGPTAGRAPRRARLERRRAATGRESRIPM